MRSLIEKAVESAFKTIDSLMYDAEYIEIERGAFSEQIENVYPLRVVIDTDTTKDPSYGVDNDRVISNNMRLLFLTKDLPVKAKHGDKIKVDGDTFEIKEPVLFDPIKVHTSIMVKRVS
jgi:hypothetical protein